MDAPYRSPVSTKTRRSTFAITLMRSSGQSPGWIHRGGPSHGNSRFASADCARRQGSDLRCDRRRVTRYALAFLEGDHSFTRQESHTGSFTPGNSMERVGTRWPEDRGYIESVRRRECAGTVRGVSRKRLSIALRSYDRDCHPSRRAGKLPKNDVGVRVALVVTLQEFAEVAELVDALDLGSSGAIRGGSSPPFRISLQRLGLLADAAGQSAASMWPQS